MATYVPDPTNVAEPLDSRAASTAAAEFRALKTFLTSIVSAGLPPVAGKNGWMLLADTTIPGAKWVDVKSTVLPAQAGNAGKLLGTDGTDSAWATFYSFLPTLASKGGQLVRVNAGTTAFEYVPLFGTFPAGTAGYVLALNGSNTDVVWTNTPTFGAANAATAVSNANSGQIATTAWVRQALFPIPNTAGIDALFGLTGTVSDYAQAIRENIRYIKETQIPAAAAAFATGNAASATKLQTARNIGGVAFDGTASINLPGVNAAGNQNTSGNAATATTAGTAGSATFATSAGSANLGEHLDSTTHPGTYWVSAGWDGTYWSLTANHASPVSVGHALVADNATAAASATVAANASSGSHSPTLTNTTNVSASSIVGTAQWMRSGDVVTVSGSVAIQPTAGGGATTNLTMTLPFASTFANDQDCCGVAIGGVGVSPNQVAFISGSTVDNKAHLRFFSGFTASVAFYYSYTYKVLP